MTTRITFAMEVDMGKIQELRAILSAKIDGKEVTQVGLAKATGVDQATINRFYKKGEGLSAENFIRLAEWVGARIIWPGEGTPMPPDREFEFEKLRDKIASLTRENALLQKLVAKYEEDAAVKKEVQENQSYARKPAPAIGSRMDSVSGGGKSV